MTAHCYMCGIIQTTENTNPEKNRHTGFGSRCIQCKRKYEHDRWKNNKDKIYKKHREYATSKRGKLSFKKAYKKFSKTEKGKLLSKKQNAKRRKMGFIKICENIFPNYIDVAWHHIDNDYVIALPDKIHAEIAGTHNVFLHRQLALEWVELLYPEDAYNNCLEKTSKF